MTIQIYQVDAFTDKPFSGNPAAVCLLSEPMPDVWMQQVAIEMNLSETAFLLQQGERYSLRWFTPVKEVSLCGHATLASAHVLYETGSLKPDETAHFDTMSGSLAANKKGPLIELDFPKRIEEPATAPGELLTVLGAKPIYVGKCGTKYVIEVATEGEVRNLKPDFAKMRQLEGRGVAVTSRAATEQYDFVSRYFAPWIGIDEDPVTGSIHCCLGPFWGKRLGKSELIAYQASARGGSLKIRIGEERVYLSGNAVTIFSGEMCV